MGTCYSEDSWVQFLCILWVKISRSKVQDSEFLIRFTTNGDGPQFETHDLSKWENIFPHTHLHIHAVTIYTISYKKRGE